MVLLTKSSTITRAVKLKINNMKELFVPCPIALLAKEKGFDEPCFGWYFGDESGDLHIEFIRKQSFPTISAPLYHQLTDWFLTKDIAISHKVHWMDTIREG